MRSDFLPLISSNVRLVLMVRTPQLMSKPIPPGEMDPESASTAATPPMGNPYPKCMSGMAKDLPTMPGRHATFATCCGELSSMIESNMLSFEKITASVLIQGICSLDISHLLSSIFLNLPLQAMITSHQMKLLEVRAGTEI